MNSNVERQDNFFDVCSSCESNCCRNARPPMTLKRKRVIEAYLKKQKISIENAFVKEAYIFPREDAEGFCIFHDKSVRKCLVHDVKPETCVAGPVTFDINIPNQKIEWHLKMEKICPLVGRLYKNAEILQRHLESAKREIFELVCELDAKALKAILKIEEPETFKIDEDNIRKKILEKIMADFKE